MNTRHLIKANTITPLLEVEVYAPKEALIWVGEFGLLRVDILTKEVIRVCFDSHLFRLAF
jgi:hypothetical protein